MHAAVGRQREDLDQRLGLAQPPRAIGDDVVADGDRETAQQADARLGAVARGSPLPDEPNASTRGRRARRRSPRTGAAASARSSCHEGSTDSALPARSSNTAHPPLPPDRSRHLVILQPDTHPPRLSHGCGCLQRFRRGARFAVAVQTGAPAPRRPVLARGTCAVARERTRRSGREGSPTPPRTPREARGRRTRGSLRWGCRRRARMAR